MTLRLGPSWLFSLSIALACTGASGAEEDSGTGTETSAGSTGSGETGSTEGTGMGEETGTSEETGSTEETGTTEETGDPSQCPEVYSCSGYPGECVLPPVFVECDLSQPCQTVSANEDEGGTGGGGSEIQNPDALNCVTTALENGDPGEYRFSVSSYISGDDIRVRVYAGGYMEWSIDSWFDKSGDASRRPGHLDDQHDFAACNDIQTWSGTWNCLRGGFVECVSWDEDAVLCPQ